MLSALRRPLVLAALLLFGLPGRSGWLAPAMGQTPALPTDDKVYTYVEQMPRLPGGSGQAAIIAAVQQCIVLPAGTTAASNRVFVKFIIGKQGQVESAEIIKGVAPVVDAAVLAAVRQLPTFEPGRQGGRPVRLAFTLPITPPGLVVQEPPLVASPPAAAEAQTQAKAQAQAQAQTETLRRGLATRQPGEADSTFLRRVLPASFPPGERALAATWRPSAFGKQLFFSEDGTSGGENEYGTDLFMLDPFQANTYAVQVFTIPTQGDHTYLEAFFFADVDRDGQKELLAISECSLRESFKDCGQVLYGRTSHYQTLVFQYTGLSSTGRPQYRDYPASTDYLDELATAAEVRQALARHQQRRKTPTRPPAARAKK